jgi:CRISPR/Cas system-associated endonuclease Cas3-HD
LKERLKQTQDFYDEQQLLAGDNEKAKQRLRLEEERATTKLRNDIARKEKQAARTHILIDIATGIAKALATYPWPYSLIPAAAVAIQGAAQLAIVNRAPSNFAEGVIDLKGPGTAKSDSIPANLSKGESVMTAWETKHANQVLKDVRARKLDDRVLRDLRNGGRQPAQVLNDERIIKAIKDQKPPDVVKIGSTLYDVRKQTETYKKRIRNSSLSI